MVLVEAKWLSPLPMVQTKALITMVAVELIAGLSEQFLAVATTLYL